MAAPIEELLVGALRKAPLDELIYQGVRERWEYTLPEILRRIERGEPLGATRLAYSAIPFAQSHEFMPRVAVGQRALPLLRGTAKMPEPLGGQELARVMHQAPLSEEAYRAYYKRLSELGVSRSWLGVQPTVEPSEWIDPLTGEPKPRFGPPLPEFHSPSLLTVVVPPTRTHDPFEVRVLPTTPRHLPKWAGSALYRDIIDSFQDSEKELGATKLKKRMVGGMHDNMVRILKEIESGRPSESARDVVRTIAQFAPRGSRQRMPGYPVGPSPGQERNAYEQGEWAKAWLREFTNPKTGFGGKAIALIRLYDAVHGTPGLDLYKPQSAEGTKIMSALRVVDLRIAERLGVKTAKGAERAFLPAVRQAYVDSEIDDAWGAGSADFADYVVGQWLPGKTQGAKATSMWFNMHVGNVPASTTDFLLDVSAISRRLGLDYRSRQLAFYARNAAKRGGPLPSVLPPVRGRGYAILQGLASMVLDDAAEEAALKPLKSTIQTVLHERLAKSLLMTPGGKVIAVGAFGALALAPLLMPKPADAASLPPEIGGAAARAFGHAAGATAGEMADQALGQDVLKVGTAALEGASRTWGYMMSRLSEVIKDATDRILPSLPADMRPRFQAGMGRLQQDTATFEYTRTRILDYEIYAPVRAIEAEIRSHGALTSSQQLAAWKRIHDLATLTHVPDVEQWEHQAAGQMREVFDWIHKTALDVDQEGVRPYRSGYWPDVYDPKKIERLWSTPGLADAWYARATKERLAHLQGLYARDREGFWSEVTRYMPTPEIEEMRRRARESPGELTGLFTAIAESEASRTLAQLKQSLRIPAASRLIQDMVTGDSPIPPWARSLGEMEKPLSRSPYLSEPRRFGLEEFLYDHPMDRVRVYAPLAASHIASASVFGPKAERLEEYRLLLSDARTASSDPQLSKHLWSAWESLRTRMWGRQEDSFIDQVNRVFLPAAVISRMTTTAIPHLFQTLNAAALNSWGSYTKSLVGIAGGGYQDALHLAELASGMHTLDWFGQSEPWALSKIAQKWLGFIQFSAVRRFLLASSALTAHEELIPMVRAVMEDPGQMPALQAYLKRIGFGRKPTLEEAASAAEHLVEQMKAGGIPDNVKAIVRSRTRPTVERLRQDPYLRVIAAATDASAFNFRPWDFPAFWHTPIGRTVTLFRRFFYEQWNQMYKQAWRDAKEGNLVPMATLVGPQVLGGGLVLGTVRSYIHGRPTAWDDPRRKPFLIGGVEIPDRMYSMMQIAEEGGWFGMMGDLYRIAADPQQPYLGILGVIGGFLPTEMARLALSFGPAIQATVHGGLDPAKTRDFADARMFLRLIAQSVPLIGGYLADLPVMRTGRARYLRLRQEAIRAGLDGDGAHFAEVNAMLDQEYGRPVDDGDIAQEAMRRRRIQQGLPARAPLPGQPGYTPGQ